MLDIKEIYSSLLNHFGKQNWWPTISNNKAFEISIGAILTQNTSWKNVEKAIKNLKDNNLLSKDAIKKIKVERLAKLIKSSGYHNQKAKKLKEFVKFLESSKEINRENLLSIWGIGKETADSILLYAYNKPIFVIDSYTKRVFSRLGLCYKDIGYEELQNLFHKNLLKDYKLFNEYHALIVRLAKDICKTKPLCHKCPLNSICSYRLSL